MNHLNYINENLDMYTDKLHCYNVLFIEDLCCVIAMWIVICCVIRIIFKYMLSGYRPDENVMLDYFYTMKNKIVTYFGAAITSIFINVSGIFMVCDINNINVWHIINICVAFEIAIASLQAQWLHPGTSGVLYAMSIMLQVWTRISVIYMLGLLLFYTYDQSNFIFYMQSIMLGVIYISSCCDILHFTCDKLKKLLDGDAKAVDELNKETTNEPNDDDDDDDVNDVNNAMQQTDQ